MIVTAIETLTEESLNLAFVKTRLLDQEIKLKNESNENSAKVLNVVWENTSKKSFDNASKGFHGKIKTNKRNNSIKCHHCGRKGHIKSNCYYYKRTLQHKGEAKKNPRANIAKQKMRSLKKEKEAQGTRDFAFMAGGCEDTTKNKITFYLDSGSTYHLINRI